MLFMATTFDTNLISSKEASVITGYVADYITRLCRQGKIRSQQMGRSWFIDKDSLLAFVEEERVRKEKMARELATKREEEYRLAKAKREAVEPVLSPYMPLPVRPEWLEETGQGMPVRGSFAALAATLAILATGLYAGLEETRAGVVVFGAQFLEYSSELAQDIGTRSVVQGLDNTVVASLVVAAPRVLSDQKRPIVITAVNSEDEALATSTRVIQSDAIEHNQEISEFVAVGSSIGKAIVETSDAILGAHERGVNAWVRTTPEVPAQIIAFVYDIGYATAAVGNTAPREAIASVGSLENVALGVVGHVALAYDTTRDTLAMAYEYAPVAAVARAPKHITAKEDSLSDSPEEAPEAVQVTLIEVEEEIPSDQLAAAHGAFEEAALFTYEALNSLFRSTGDAFASLFSPGTSTPARPIVITSTVPSKPSAASTSSSPITVVTYVPVVTNDSTTQVALSGITMEEVIDRVNFNLDHHDDRVDEKLEELREELQDQIEDISGASGTVTSVDVSGGTTGLSFAGGPVTNSGTLTMAGTLAIANGGTGIVTAPTYGQVLVGNGSGGYNLVATSTLGISGGGGSNTFSYPLIESGGNVTLDFGTTTQNTWSAHNTFASLFATNASSTNATTSSLGLNAETFTDLTGTGLQNVAGALTLNATGDWTGTFDGQQGTYYLDRTNHTGTQLASTISDFSSAVNSYVHASTTIPKTYTANIFTGAQTLNGGLTLSTLNGPLQANAGVVSATTSVGVLYGGTGLTSAPSYGQLLLGQANGTYALTATSSLGLQGTLVGTTGQVAYFSGTNQAVGTSSIFIQGNGYVSMGTTNARGVLTLESNEDIQALDIYAPAVGGQPAFSVSAPLTTNPGNGKAFQIIAVGEDYARSVFYTNGAFGIGSGGSTRDTFLSRSAANTFRISSDGDSGSANLTVNGTLTAANGSFTNATTTSFGLNAETFTDLTGTGLTNIGGALSASLGTNIDLTSEVTGTLPVANGGTGSTTLSGILRGNGTGQVSTLLVGSGLSFDGTTLSASGGSGITSIGPAGQAQTGAAITFATSTSVTNGITSALTITGAGDMITFTPSQSGTLSVAGGGTGAATFTNNRLITGNGTSALVDEANLTFDGSLLTVTGNASTTQLSTSGATYLATAGGNVGIGTTTPWGQLSVNPNGITGPSFVVGSSTATNLIVTNAGNVGIGTSNPSVALNVVGSVLATGALEANGNVVSGGRIFTSNNGSAANLAGLLIGGVGTYLVLGKRRSRT